MFLKPEEGQIHISPQLLVLLAAAAAMAAVKRGSWVPSCIGTAVPSAATGQPAPALAGLALAVSGKGAIVMVDVYTSVMGFPDTKSHSQTIFSRMSQH